MVFFVFLSFFHFVFFFIFTCFPFLHFSFFFAFFQFFFFRQTTPPQDRPSARPPLRQTAPPQNRRSAGPLSARPHNFACFSFSHPKFSVFALLWGLLVGWLFGEVRNEGVPHKMAHKTHLRFKNLPKSRPNSTRRPQRKNGIIGGRRKNADCFAPSLRPPTLRPPLFWTHPSGPHFSGRFPFLWERANPHSKRASSLERVAAPLFPFLPHLKQVWGLGEGRGRILSASPNPNLKPPPPSSKPVSAAACARGGSESQSQRSRRLVGSGTSGRLRPAFQ